MSSNVGLSTPRGSGTSGYVQRNLSFLKPRDAGYGAPYPPVSGNRDGSDSGLSSFKQRKPDKQILEHDRKRAIEVKVLEERERLEEENEKIEESKETGKDDDDKKKVPLAEEEIDERCDALRQRLLKEMEEGLSGGGTSGFSRDDHRRRRDPRSSSPKERKQFKSYQVHELAEAKMQESERLRKALGIKEDWEKDGGSRSYPDRRDRDRERGMDRDRDRGRERERERERERGRDKDRY
jgi:hypothetical protein